MLILNVVILPTFVQATPTSTLNIAKTGQKISTSTNLNKINKLIAQADKDISLRVDSLNALSTRVQIMQKISDLEKADIISQIQTQITNLNTLKSKIDSETDIATLNTDLKLVTMNYRVYSLVLPRIQIIAASDRIDTIVSDYLLVSTKLQTRIATLEADGKEVSDLKLVLIDIQNKISDAQLQITAAVNRVSLLMPDEGDQAVMKSNSAALKFSRADIRVATADLQTVRKDIQKILKSVRVKNINSTSTATSTR